MSKKIVTVPGKGYVATMSAGGEISAVGDSGAKLTLVSGGAGEQVSFQAIGLEVECSDDGAVILPFSGASLSIGGGSGAGAGGDAVADAVDEALCNKVDDTVSGEAGDNSAAVKLVVLAAARVPDGYIKKVGLKNRSTYPSYLLDTAVYLAVYERDGSGEAWEKRGVSKDTVTQSEVGVSQVSEWQFEGLRVHGREMCMLWSENAQMVPEPEEAAVAFGLLVKTGVEDGSKCDSLNAVPEYTFEVQRLEPKFVAEEQLREHAEDTELHLKGGERKKWDGAVSGLETHVGDAVKHVTAEERAKWDGAVTGLTEHVGDTAKHLGAVEGETGVAYMANEGNGGIMKFTKADGSVGKVTLFDGTDGDRTYVQVTAHTGDKGEIVRMNVSPDGIYYVKGAAGGKTAEREVATVGDVAAAVGAALRNEVEDTVSGEAGDNSAAVKLVVLAAARVPNGCIKKIGLKNRATYPNYLLSKAVYLAVYERDGSGEVWEKRGVSRNTVTQSEVGVSQVSEWQFDGVNVHGREMCMLWSEDSQVVPEPEAAAIGAGLLVKTGVADGSKCDSMNAVPEYTFEVQRVEPRFAAEEQLREHVGDAVKHVTAEERTRWDGAVSGLETHAGDTVKHLGTIAGEKGEALIFNEADGGGVRFTGTDGSGALIAVNDGTDGVYAQVSAHTEGKAKIVRLNVNPDGIYYTKNAGSAGENAAEREVATVGDVTAAGLTEEQKGLLTWLAANKAGLEALLSPQE